jgi:hypothetical protein
MLLSDDFTERPECTAHLMTRRCELLLFPAYNLRECAHCADQRSGSIGDLVVVAERKSPSRLVKACNPGANTMGISSFGSGGPVTWCFALV